MANPGQRSEDWFDRRYRAITNENESPTPQPQPRESNWQAQLARENFGQPAAPTGDRDIPMDSPQPSDHENIDEVRVSIVQSYLSQEILTY